MPSRKINVIDAIPEDLSEVPDVGELVQEHALRLPELEPLLELSRPQMWFEVPGMYGGFSYHLESAGVEARLISESWCRVVDGSGQRHEITSEGSELIEEGFV